MKNFIQFIIPLLIIIVIGVILLFNSNPRTEENKLHIRCNNTTRNYRVLIGDEIDFLPKNENCNLKIKITNIDIGYVRFDTVYLWPTDANGDLLETEPRNTIIVEANQDTSFYSYDKQTKFTFSYK